MILFTNGCSWTWGGGLEPWMAENGVYNHEQRLQLVWPYHLGKMLSADDVVNLAEGCGSNQRIVRTTYDWLAQQTRETLDKTVAVIQITNTNRFELYEPVSMVKYENIPAQWIKCKWDLVVGDFGQQSKYDPDEILKKARLRTAETQDIEDVYRNLGYLYALHGLFSAYKIKEWYFWNLGNVFSWRAEFLEHNFNIFCSQFNMLDHDDTWEYERLSKNDCHPSILGHHQLANIIYNKIAAKT